MGLTINYTLSSRRPIRPVLARQIVGEMRKKALTLDFEHVSKRIKVGPDYPGIYWKPPGARRACDLIGASEGWVFYATPGDGSESVMMGLCRFPGRDGWWLESFCKTQYAARHGWEHFLKCHCAALELIDYASRFNLQVEVDDEGGLWETGSFEVLRQNLAEYEEAIAALGGALKDATGKGEGPIFDHPQFEQLEARGLAAHGEKVGLAVEVVRRLAAGGSADAT